VGREGGREGGGGGGCGRHGYMTGQDRTGQTFPQSCRNKLDNNYRHNEDGQWLEIALWGSLRHGEMAALSEGLNHVDTAERDDSGTCGGRRRGVYLELVVRKPRSNVAHT